MNSERIKVIIKLYTDRYKDLTLPGTDVRDKWAAVSCCAKNWDIQAEDFGGMFQKAMSQAVFLLDHGDVLPLEGINALCSAGKTEEVREAFSSLLSGDGGEINVRQEKVLRFQHDINALLGEVFPDKWQYKQRVRSVIKYLGLIRTSENYMLRASASCAFAGYCDFEEDLGYDKYLKLRSYYHMCDELAEYVKENDTLLELVARGLEKKAAEIGDPDLVSIDPALHILVYDIIDSAYRYDFYSDKTATRKSKISTVEKRKIDKKIKRAAFLDEREACMDSFEEIAALEKLSTIPDLLGESIHHKAFGDGKITEQSGKYLTISFEKGIKKFVLPGAVLKGFLSFDSEEISVLCESMEKIEKKKKEKEMLLNSLDVQLQLLE